MVRCRVHRFNVSTFAGCFAFRPRSGAAFVCTDADDVGGCWRLVARGELADVASAVDADGLARDEIRFQQEDDRTHDRLLPAPAPERSG
jgi:hypothetical protein